MRAVVWFVGVLWMFFALAAHASDGQPMAVTPCELRNDPGRYDHQLVEVTGMASHAFEEFDFSSGRCADQPGMSGGLWLEYGGKRQSRTVYCCVDSMGPDRDEDLVVDGLPSELVDDAVFERFDRLLHRRNENAVFATIVGRFFAGAESAQNGYRSWGGYGHLGCCSLLLVEQVLWVKPAKYDPYSKDPVVAPTTPLPPVDPRLLPSAK